MFFQSFVKQISSRHAGDFVCTSRGQRSPILASFLHQKEAKRFDFQSNIETSMQWIFGPRLNLILFPYMQASQP